MISNKHPFHRLREYLLSHFPDMILEFSKYVYVQYGETLSRNTFQIQASQLTEEWVEKQIVSLSELEEFALHSRVKKHKGDTNYFHLPMIDFINSNEAEVLLERVKSIENIVQVPLWVYNSGNSMHGYYFALLSEPSWYKYLGTLLLCNAPSKVHKDYIDARWIGHSLEQGFSALRWSKNTQRYKSLPELVTSAASIPPSQT